MENFEVHSIPKKLYFVPSVSYLRSGRQKAQ
jgi:hypothetical protein